MKTKVTSGKNWQLITDNDSKPAKPVNPKSPVPRIQLEHRTGGKTVTVISGLQTYGSDRLHAIARDLKASCGAGGTVKFGTIEIQGDHVTVAKKWFESNKK